VGSERAESVAARRQFRKSALCIRAQFFGDGRSFVGSSRLGEHRRKTEALLDPEEPHREFVETLFKIGTLGHQILPHS